MSYKSKEQELSMDEELVQRQREQALMEEFIKNKGVTKLPPDERLAAYSGRSKYRPTLMVVGSFSMLHRFVKRR